jgi:hypothetical protein
MTVDVIGENMEVKRLILIADGAFEDVKIDEFVVIS